MFLSITFKLKKCLVNKVLQVLWVCMLTLIGSSRKMLKSKAIEKEVFLSDVVITSLQKKNLQFTEKTRKSMVSQENITNLSDFQILQTSKFIMLIELLKVVKNSRYQKNFNILATLSLTYCTDSKLLEKEK